jgi:hypothetical protein
MIDSAYLKLLLFQDLTILIFFLCTYNSSVIFLFSYFISSKSRNSCLHISDYFFICSFLSFFNF